MYCTEVKGGRVGCVRAVCCGARGQQWSQQRHTPEKEFNTGKAKRDREGFITTEYIDGEGNLSLRSRH